MKNKIYDPKYLNGNECGLGIAGSLKICNHLRAFRSSYCWEEKGGLDKLVIRAGKEHQCVRIMHTPGTWSVQFP